MGGEGSFDRTIVDRTILKLKYRRVFMILSTIILSKFFSLFLYFEL